MAMSSDRSSDHNVSSIPAVFRVKLTPPLIARARHERAIQSRLEAEPAPLFASLAVNRKDWKTHVCGESGDNWDKYKLAIERTEETEGARGILKRARDRASHVSSIHAVHTPRALVVAAVARRNAAVSSTASIGIELMAERLHFAKQFVLL